MSSASFSSSTRRSTKKGFSQQEVQNFMNAGNVQGVNKQGSFLIDRKFKPQEKSLTTTTTTQTAGGLARMFGASNSGTRVTQSGFMGQFANISQEELDQATETFMQRKKQIQQRAGTFGRAGLLLER